MNVLKLFIFSILLFITDNFIRYIMVLPIKHMFNNDISTSYLVNYIYIVYGVGISTAIISSSVICYVYAKYINANYCIYGAVMGTATALIGFFMEAEAIRNSFFVYFVEMFTLILASMFFMNYFGKKLE